MLENNRALLHGRSIIGNSESKVDQRIKWVDRLKSNEQFIMNEIILTLYYTYIVLTILKKE